MKHLYTFTGVICLSVSSTIALAGDYNFKPGLWESTATTKITGVPPEVAQFMANMSNNTHTETRCVMDVDTMLNADSNCDVKYTRVNAGEILVDLSCNTPEGPSSGKGEIYLKGTTASGSLAMDMPGGQFGAVKMKSTFKGKYIGACK